MKHKLCVLAAMAALTAAPVWAGSVSDPIVESIIVDDTTSSSSSGTAIVALLAILVTLPTFLD